MAATHSGTVLALVLTLLHLPASKSVSLFGLSALHMPCQREEWVWTLSSAKAWQVRAVAAVANSSLVLHVVKITMILGNMSVYMNTG